MGRKNKDLIKLLLARPEIARQSEAANLVQLIGKFAENDSEIESMLKLFFKNRFDFYSLNAEDQELLSDRIKKSSLVRNEDFPNWILWILIIGGFIGIGVGLNQLINKRMSVGLDSKYLLFVVREGGAKVIASLVLVIGGIARLNHTVQKKNLLKILSTAK